MAKTGNLPRDFGTVCHELGRRRSRRYATCQPVTLQAPDRPCLARLRDLSSHGALLLVPRGLALRPSTPLVFSFIEGTRNMARVRWMTEGLAGLEFDVPLLDVSDHLDHDHLGADYFVALARMQRMARSMAGLETLLLRTAPGVAGA